ncbi:MAG: Eco57I restriction-modification methylase domain-containing protein, partial [Muribaculaceae bacterium]
MAQLYSKQQLREIFQSPFNQESWKAILHNLFRAEMIRKQAEKFTAEGDNEDGFYLGAHETSDSYRIGLFYFVIKTGSVAHKKVGLRNLVKQFVNPTWGEFDAAIVVFDDKREWRLSFVCDIKDVKTTPKRYTFVFGEHDNFYRTAIERFLTIQNSEPTFENIRKAFSVDALSDDFFDTYREYYADFVQYITGKRYVKDGNKWVERELGKPNFQYTTTFDCNDKLVRDYVKKMFGRIVFLYFLQRKGWLNGDRQYMHNLFYNSTAKDNFLDGVLEPLFFEVLNTDKQYRTADANALPGSENIPYLNGGLFARDEIDELDCVFPEDYFQKLFDFLDSYNFTIDENDVDDAEIGIDPEMLGRIFENLLEDNKDKGAFYTPKEIVNYMCRESLIAYLQNGVPERSHELIRNFVENCDASQLNAEQNKYLRKKLQDVKICDPAIGSGAFPMGLVNILSRLYIAMKADTDTSKMKRHIIENNIYGVDIEKGAVDIARLRFWLAMIVEEKEPMPLPNLHFKIMQGNSLLESINGIDLSDLTKTKAARSLFDSTDTERENLKTALSQYYNTSNHADRDRLFNEIINNVRRQIYAKDSNIDQTGLDPSANDKFFLWHTWFADVFDEGGFDIVIGNPPYGYLFKDSKYRNQIISNYSVAEYKVEAYSVFTQFAHKLLRNNGVLSFITPYTFVSGIYFSKFRKFLANTGVRTFVLLGKKVFEDAEVDTAIFLLQKEKNIENIQFADLRPFESARDLDSMQLSQIRSSDFFA